MRNTATSWISGKKAIQEKNHDKIKSSMESVQKVSHKLAEEVYKAASSQQAGPEAGAAQGAGPEHNAESQEKPAADKPKDDVIDAEVVDDK